MDNPAATHGGAFGGPARVFAFHCRTGGPRAYEHGILDLAAVVYQEGEVVDEFDTLLSVSDNLGYRPAWVKRALISHAALSEGEDYFDGLHRFLEWLDARRGPASVWTFESDRTVPYVATGARQGSLPYALDRTADLCQMFAVLFALGVHRVPSATVAGIQRTLSRPLIDPTMPAREVALNAAVAASELIEMTHNHFAGQPPAQGNVLAAYLEAA